jgi:transketolase
VGEDGPTHQPVEQEAQARLLEQLKNHSGQPSLLVLRPADAKETARCWKIALENAKTPTALLLSRQGIPPLPAKEGSTRYQDTLEVEKGAYILQNTEGDPDVVLVGNGSEVSTLVEGADKLRKKENLKVRIVSAPSEGLFRQQPKAYQESVLPDGIPTFGLTAGLPITLQRLVGSKGEVFGLDHFGYSAPYKVLDEKFGFTGENVYKQVARYLKQYV